jgi:hypothetical protein
MFTFTQGHALAVDVGDDLPGTVDDARALARILTAPGRCAYPPNHVELPTGEDATRGHILRFYLSPLSRPRRSIPVPIITPIGIPRAIFPVEVSDTPEKRGSGPSARVAYLPSEEQISHQLAVSPSSIRHFAPNSKCE